MCVVGKRRYGLEKGVAVRGTEFIPFHQPVPNSSLSTLISPTSWATVLRRTPSVS